MRSLDPDEKALWDRVAATIRPLSREPPSSAQAPAKPKPREGARAAAHPLRTRSAPPIPSKREALESATLDSHWDRRLRSGSVEPDRVLDLHGLTLDQAWRAIDRALERAIADKARLLLLITGHAPAGAAPVQRGKIRAAVHDWLAASPHARSIAAVRGAHRRHGGGGSLYIILRRRESRSTLS